MAIRILHLIISY